MPEYTKDVVKARLKTKLRARPARSTKHTFFDVYDDEGNYLVQTHVSHGRGPVPKRVIGLMANELKVKGATFRALLDCTITREVFLTAIGEWDVK